jgi:hypothetical protein
MHFDKLDNGILDQTQHLADTDIKNIDEKIDSLFKSFAYLMKHDWERAKREARFWKCPCRQEESPRPQ